jgi:hypothetical protein
MAVTWDFKKEGAEVYVVKMLIGTMHCMSTLSCSHKSQLVKDYCPLGRGDMTLLIVDYRKISPQYF